MDGKRHAARLGGLAILILFVGALVAILFPKLEVELTAVAFVGFVVFGGRALALVRADDIVFDSKVGLRTSERTARSAVHAGLAAGTLGALALGRAAAAARPPSSPNRRATPRPLHPVPLPKTR